MRAESGGLSVEVFRWGRLVWSFLNRMAGGAPDLLAPGAQW